MPEISFYIPDDKLAEIKPTGLTNERDVFHDAMPFWYDAVKELLKGRAVFFGNPDGSDLKPYTRPSFERVSANAAERQNPKRPHLDVVASQPLLPAAKVA